MHLKENKRLEDEVPTNMEDFVQDVLRRAKEEQHRYEHAFRYHQKHKNDWLRLIFSPDGYWKRVWDWVVTAVIILSVLIVPMLLGFSDGIEPTLMIGFLVGADAVWWVDILVTFRTASKLEHFFEGGLRASSSAREMSAFSYVTQPSQIARLYAKTHLTLDLFAGLPYYALLFHQQGLCASRLAGAADAFGQRTALVLLSLLPMLVLLRLRRIVRTEHVRSVLYRDSDGNQLVRLVVLFLYLSHSTGCIFFFVSLVELRHGISRHSQLLWTSGQDALPPQMYASFLPEGYALLLSYNASGVGLLSPDLEDMSGFDCYVFAFVWGMLNVSGVNFSKPVNAIQTSVAFIVVCCAIMTNSMIIGSVTTTLSRLNHARHSEHQRRQAIEVHLRHHSVPRALRARVQQFYDFIGGVAEATPREVLLPALPRGLAFQLDMLQKREVFTKIPFFAECTHEQILDLVPRVQLTYAMPGRTIIREGMVSIGLYMISRGRIRIMKGGTLLNERIVGEFVGERSLTTEQPAQASCITADFCELFLLKKPDFKELVVAYPELLGRINFFASRKDKAAHQAACTKHMRQQINDQATRDMTRVKKATADPLREEAGIVTGGAVVRRIRQSLLAVGGGSGGGAGAGGSTNLNLLQMQQQQAGAAPPTLQQQASKTKFRCRSTSIPDNYSARGERAPMGCSPPPLQNPSHVQI